jgi:hypothetical protein
MSEQNQAKGAAKLRVNGSAPSNACLAGLVEAAPDLMDALASEFAPIAAALATQRSYWVAINAWITDRLSGPIMEGKASADDISSQVWAAFATAYWGGMELRENWGMPPAMETLGIKVMPPFAEPLQGFADSMAPRIAALNGGGDECLQLLSMLLHDDSGMGAIWNTAYNAGCQVVLTEDPPLGHRRPERAPKPSFVRVNTRDFMRVDYELPTPNYLKVWRSAFERAVLANPQAYEREIVGGPGQTDLRAIWNRGVTFGNTTWGDSASAAWTDAYFDDTVHWSTVVNFGLEAVSLAALVAVINQDCEAARRAVMGNALYAGMGTGWLIGFLDTDGQLPTIAAA